jgi:hypothetical protein
MRKIITALLLIAMPIIAMGQEATHEQILRELRAEIKRQEIALREVLVWQETVLRSQIQYQIDEMRNRLFVERLFPDVYAPFHELILPMLMLPTLELPDLFIPDTED